MYNEHYIKIWNEDKICLGGLSMVVFPNPLSYKENMPFF